MITLSPSLKIAPSSGRVASNVSPKETTMNTKLKFFLGLDRPLLTLSSLCIIITLHFAFPRYLVATGSMDPTIPSGSIVVACRLPTSIDKNDIAVFEPVEGVSSNPWVHRIMANAGEDYSPMNRKGRVDISTNATAQPTDYSPQQLLIPENFFYQSGDSSNSYHGLVPQKLVIAKVLFHFNLPWK